MVCYMNIIYTIFSILLNMYIFQVVFLKAFICLWYYTCREVLCSCTYTRHRYILQYIYI